MSFCEGRNGEGRNGKDERRSAMGVECGVLDKRRVRYHAQNESRISEVR